MNDKAFASRMICFCGKTEFCEHDSSIGPLVFVEKKISLFRESFIFRAFFNFSDRENVRVRFDQIFICKSFISEKGIFNMNVFFI